MPEDLLSLIEQTGFDELAVTFEHATEAARLPLLHRYLFDRMLIAQARLEGLTLASADEAIAAYDVDVLRVARA